MMNFSELFFGYDYSCDYFTELVDNSNPEDFRRSRSATESLFYYNWSDERSQSDSELEGKVDGMAFQCLFRLFLVLIWANW